MIQSKTMILLLCFLAASVQATIKNEEIKALDLTEQGFDDLNPLHGIPWADGILENHGELLAQTDPLRIFIQILFHRTGTFDPSTRDETNSVVPYLKPRIIGEFVGAFMAKKPYPITIPGGGTFQGARTSNNSFAKALEPLKNDPRLFRVMQALLWFKAQSRADFAQYYEGIRKYLPNAIKEMPPGWLNEKYSVSDVLSKEQPPTEPLDDFLYWVKTEESKAPALEHQAYSKSRFGSFADCGETSLRNFLKLISDEKGKYNIEVLKELGASLPIIEFFGKYPDRVSQANEAGVAGAKNARDAFADVVVDQVGVRYVGGEQAKQELDAGASNMLALIKALFSKVSDRDDWGAVGEKIQAARKKHGLGDFSFEEVTLASDFGEIEFKVEGFGKFRWFFQSYHFYVDALPDQGMSNYPKKEIDDIAIYYRPQNQLRPKQLSPWYLFTRLRQNEKIESALKTLEGDKLTLDIMVGLLNRLSTNDARKRVFRELREQINFGELSRRKDFIGNEIYLQELLTIEKFDDARMLVESPWYRKNVEQYFIGHEGKVNSAVWNFIGHEGKVNSAVWSKDENQVLTAGRDGSARIWDAKTGKQVDIYQDPGKDFGSAFWNNDEKQLLIASSDKARIVDIKSKSEIASFAGHQVNFALWNPLETLVLACATYAGFDSDSLQKKKGYEDVAARIWDVKTGQVRATLKHPELSVLSMIGGGVTKAAFSPDGRKIITQGRAGDIRVWNVDSGQELHVFHDVFAQEKTIENLSKVLQEFPSAPCVGEICWSKDSQKVVFYNSPGNIAIFDLVSNQLVGWFTALERNGPGSLFFGAGKARSITCDIQEECLVTDLINAKTIKKIKGYSAVWSTDGSRALTVNPDGTARIWSIDEKKGSPRSPAR